MANDEAASERHNADTGEPAIGFMSQIRMMLRALWGSPVRSRLIFFWTLILAIILATAFVQVLLNDWNGTFYDSLERRDLSGFLHQLRIFAVIAGVLLLLNVGQTWVNQILAIRMRDGLTRDLLGQWLYPRRALRLSAAGILGVNPDQRLHEDSAHLSDITTSLAIGLTQSTIMLVSFVGVLWDLSSGFSVTFHGQPLAIPGYMVWAVFLYAGSASLLSTVVGRSLPALTAERYAKEAQLRTSLMRANENLTAITLQQGEETERRRIDGDISAILKTMGKLAMATTNLRWVSAGYGWLTIIAPILIAAPVYFSGDLTFGGLMMAVGAFNQVYTALRWYVDNFSTIADWKASLMRVANFRQALVLMETHPPAADCKHPAQADEDAVVLRNVAVSAGQASGSFRLKETDIVSRPGERIVVNGDPGANRRLLFAALAGWWADWTGTIVLPEKAHMLFVPYVSYLPQAPLRDAIAFPVQADAYGDERIGAALERVGLAELIPRLDVAARWDRQLDREQQVALAVARILLTPADWIVFEDTLEGLEPEVAERLSSALASLDRVGIIYIGRSEAFIAATRPRILHLEVTNGAEPVPQPA